MQQLWQSIYPISTPPPHSDSNYHPSISLSPCVNLFPYTEPRPLNNTKFIRLPSSTLAPNDIGRMFFQYLYMYLHALLSLNFCCQVLMCWFPQSVLYKFFIFTVDCDDYWKYSGRWNEDWQAKLKYSEKPCLCATVSTTNPTTLTCNWTRVAEVGIWRLTTWARAFLNML